MNILRAFRRARSFVFPSYEERFLHGWYGLIKAYEEAFYLDRSSPFGGIKNIINARQAALWDPKSPLHDEFALSPKYTAEELSSEIDIELTRVKTAMEADVPYAVLPRVALKRKLKGLKYGASQGNERYVLRLNILELFHDDVQNRLLVEKANKQASIHSVHEAYDVFYDEYFKRKQADGETFADIVPALSEYIRAYREDGPSPGTKRVRARALKQAADTINSAYPTGEKGLVDDADLPKPVLQACLFILKAHGQMLKEANKPSKGRPFSSGLWRRVTCHSALRF